MKKTNNYGRTVTLKAKTPDFQLITRSKTFGGEVRRLEDLIKTAFDLLEEHREAIPAARLLGVAVSNLEKEHQEEGIQLELDFDGE